MTHIDLLWTPEPRLAPRTPFTQECSDNNGEGIHWAIMKQYTGGYFFFRGDEAIEWADDAGFPPQSVAAALSDLCNLQLVRRLGTGRYLFVAETTCEEVHEMMRELNAVRKAERAKALRGKSHA